MSKQTSVELPNVTSEKPIGQSTAIKRKRGEPKKQTEASLGRREGLSDMCDGKSSDVERKRSRLGQILTLQELIMEGVGCFTIKTAVTIVALSRHRYSYPRCVDCWKKAVQNTEGKYYCVQHPEKETEKSTACEFYYDKETLTCGSLLSTRSPRKLWVLLSKSSALSTTMEGRDLSGK